MKNLKQVILETITESVTFKASDSELHDYGEKYHGTVDKKPYSLEVEYEWSKPHTKPTLKTHIKKTHPHLDETQVKRVADVVWPHVRNHYEKSFDMSYDSKNKRWDE